MKSFKNAIKIINKTYSLKYNYVLKFNFCNIKIKFTLDNTTNYNIKENTLNKEVISVNDNNNNNNNNKLIPNKTNNININIIDEAKEYKIKEDSSKELIKELNIKELSTHLKFKEEIKEVILNDKQEEYFNKTGIVIKTNKNDLFFKSNLDPHNYLINYRDKDYKVDIEEVLNKDLYEKQRTVDFLVENNKDEVNKLLSSYNNKYINYIKKNKFLYKIYENPYISYKNNKNKSKFNIFNNANSSFLTLRNKTITNTCLLSILIVILYNISPLLLILLPYHIFKLINNFYFLNSLIHEIYIDNDKQKLYIRNFNFLGFEKNPNYIRKTDIIKCKVLKDVYYNKYLNLSNKLTNKEKNNINNKNALIDKNTKDIFYTFYRILTPLGIYHLPADASFQSENTIEDLTINVLNGDIDKVVNYDYTNIEKVEQDKYNNYILAKKIYHNKRYEYFITEEEKLQKLYCKYEDNFDFEDFDQTHRLKDKSDGYYVNNSYR